MVDFIRTTAAVIAMALLFVLVVVSFTHMGNRTTGRSGDATKAKPRRKRIPSKAKVIVETNVEVKSNIMRNSGLGAIFAAILAVCGVVLLFMTYFTVAEYERAVLTRFGQVQSVEGPGLHFKMPFVNSVQFYRTDIQASATRQPINTYTIDNQEVDVMFTIHFRLTPDKIELYIVTGKQIGRAHV